MPVQSKFPRLFREVCTIDISVQQFLEMPGRNLGELQPNILTKIQRVESEYLRVPVSRIAMEPALDGVRHGHSFTLGRMHVSAAQLHGRRFAGQCLRAATSLQRSVRDAAGAFGQSAEHFVVARSFRARAASSPAGDMTGYPETLKI